MGSLFGQVWLWSLLSFVAGAALTWLVLVRPAKRELEDLEERLLTSPRPTPATAPQAARDEFDSWHVEASRSLSDVQPVAEPTRFERPAFDRAEPVEYAHDEPRYDVSAMKLDKRDELLEELDDEHRPLSDFEESHDFPEFEEERPRSLFDRLDSETDTHETLEPKPGQQPTPPPSSTRVVPQPFPRAERPQPADEPELPVEETNLLPAVPPAPVAEVAPRREEPTAPPEVQAFQPREVWREEPVREVYQDEVAEGREEEDEPERKAAEETAFIPATALAEAIAEVDRGHVHRGDVDQDEEQQVWPEHDLTGHFQPVTVPDEEPAEREPEERESVERGPRTEVMRSVRVGDETGRERRSEAPEPITTTLPEIPAEATDGHEGSRDAALDAGVDRPRSLAEHQAADERFFADLQGGDRHASGQDPADRHPADRHPADRHAADRRSADRHAAEPVTAEQPVFDPPPAERPVAERPAVQSPAGPAAEQTAIGSFEPVPAEPREPEQAEQAEPEPVRPRSGLFTPASERTEADEVEPVKPAPAKPAPSADVPFEPTFVDSGEPLVVRSADPTPRSVAMDPPKGDGPRPRSLFEPLVTDDELPETARPTPPPTPGGDQPFVPTLAPELLASTGQAQAAGPTAGPNGLPQRPTRQSGERRTPPPLSAPKPATPLSARPVRPRPVGFSPSTGGRPAAGAGSTRYRGQEEGFNPRSPFGPGSVLPKSDGLAPAPEFQVKATLTGRRYFTNDSANFRETRADVWFRTTSDAEKAGFHQAP
ncbi:sunset domain-containing protein [Saccharothrix yanglingensis]|uniref:Uncharacterized protein n=1 Tax=Saccharothrix yanglingensis TaxID=659496 RepID=A0ABU0WS15_9PSEU|nr:hypothetical protein [Saccharothrix yanglingensis]MDQ2582625.1 hypothetical protein [Saccharothrix yanglingensis]